MIRLSIRCRAEDAEMALAELMELAPSGVEEVRDDDFVEYAVYGAPGEVPRMPDLRAAVGDRLVEVTSSEIADDWRERWKDFHKPVLVGDAARERVLLRPTWEPADERVDALEIVLDPGQAFGTGSHPTTRLCLDLMLDLPRGGELVDLGCGSGVLAIVAKKLGWSPVRGYDFDRLAVEATVRNASRNDVAIEVARADLREGLPPLAPTVVANLMRPLLLDVAGRLAEAPDVDVVRRVVMSGLLDEEADEVVAAFVRLGLRERRRIGEGGWTGLLLDR